MRIYRKNCNLIGDWRLAVLIIFERANLNSYTTFSAVTITKRNRILSWFLYMSLETFLPLKGKFYVIRK